MAVGLTTRPSGRVGAFVGTFVGTLVVGASVVGSRLGNVVVGAPTGVGWRVDNTVGINDGVFDGNGVGPVVGSDVILAGVGTVVGEVGGVAPVEDQVNVKPPDPVENASTTK